MMQFIMHLSMGNLVKCDITIDIKKKKEAYNLGQIKKERWPIFAGRREYMFYRDTTSMNSYSSLCHQVRLDSKTSRMNRILF